MDGHLSRADIESELAEARRLEEQGLLDDAEAHYRKLMPSKAWQPTILARLAHIAKGRGRYVEAEALLRDALVVVPTNPGLLNNLGNVLSLQNRPTEAKSCYERATQIDPAFVDAHYNLGALFEIQQLTGEALASYRRVAQLQPQHERARIRIAAILLSWGEHHQAMAEIDAALLQNRNSFQGHYYKGMILSALERREEAIQAYSEALRLQPGNSDATLNMANNLFLLERFESSIALCEQSLDRNPSHVATHELLNRAKWVSNDHAGFLSSYAKARQRVGDSVKLLVSEAHLRMQREDMDGAEPLLLRASDLEPESAETLALLGRLNARKGRFATSFNYFNAALWKSPHHASYHNEYGFALLQGGEPSLAKQHFEQAHSIAPLDQTALGGMSLAYRALGDSSRYQDLVRPAEFVHVAPIRSARDFNESLARELRQLHTHSVAPLEQTLRGGTQTAGYLFRRRSKMIEEVQELIAEEIGRYIDGLPTDAAHPFLARKHAQFSFTHSWSSKLQSCGYHTNHVHPMGWISAAYYVQLPTEIAAASKRQGWLKLGESHLNLSDSDRPERFVQPIVGHLVLFPSYFWHGTVPFVSSEDRLTISCDVVPSQEFNTGRR